MTLTSLGRAGESSSGGLAREVYDMTEGAAWSAYRVLFCLSFSFSDDTRTDEIPRNGCLSGVAEGRRSAITMMTAKFHKSVITA
jgi:hypothetical protein